MAGLLTVMAGGLQRMGFEDFLRAQLRRPFTKGHRTVLEGRIPSLENRFEKVYRSFESIS